MKKRQTQESTIIRVRVPKGKEVLGVLDQRLGASRARVKCLDGKSRICRIPGRLKRKIWIREKDIVLVEPWAFESEAKGDILFKYNPNQVDVLKKKGLLKKLESAEEF